MAARAFLAGLSADRLASVQYSDIGNAARTTWSNLPHALSPRVGVALGDLSESQRVLLHGLLRASTSSQGYLKMTGSMRADDVLHDLQQSDQFGSANFFTTAFGSPGDANWAWMLTGHHMTAIFTVADDRTAFTPMLTGAQPLQVPSGLYAGWQVLPQDAGRAGELLAALSSDQQNVAIIGTSAPGDVVAGPGRQQSLSSFQGIPASQLDAGQQRLLWLLVQEFVGNADFDAAEAQLTLIQDTWGDTHFAWQGPAPAPSARYYFRVHGPRILIEYDVQEPLTSRGGHVHAITRDPVNDYGSDWLGLHYQEPAQGGPGGPGGPPPGGASPAPSPSAQ
ncbi:MAG TPA: DUF3500 domain-containing protein [Dehalococcoidia bacterium]